MNKAFVFFIAISSIVLLSKACLAQETITISTYYPSPYGSYNELRSEKVALGLMTTMPTNGELGWGNVNASGTIRSVGLLSRDQGASIILGSSGSVGAQPYIALWSGSSTSEADFRIQVSPSRPSTSTANTGKRLFIQGGTTFFSNDDSSSPASIRVADIYLCSSY